MLAPAGVDKKKLAQMPVKKHKSESPAAQITTFQKLLNTRIALSAGKTSRLEIIIAPISRMPITIVSAVNTAISPLKASTFMPEALAKVSSKVTKNMRL